ncbi:pseudouridylate synthase 7 homolog [Homalodisca vitripennis]|uniref:pseudouridylate synthase 7 homolog n=1 Tax=Homalodisca vitripennis TaxID=197043 RepID=UPI001EEB45F1|nr:pseudouridylate synthase 7 homolog [Homalodisca vitripennis]
MEENSPPKSEDKPFSVLARFRQLKKEKEHTPTTTSAENDTLPTTSGTVFQTSKGSNNNSSEREFEKRDGVINERRTFRGKRSLHENSVKPDNRLPGDLHLSQHESDVGITEFIRDGPGFEVIIKHRYTDFQVNEIDLSGNVVKLTSTDLLGVNSVSETLSEEEDPTIMSPEQWAALKEVSEKSLPTTVNIDVTNLDKDQRQRIHKAVKRRFGTRVYSNTKEIDGKKVMLIGHASGDSNHRFCSWPKERPEYLHFVMYKENIEMSEVVTVLSRYTRFKPNRFGYAGNKDKRAVTTQQMCVRRGDCQRFTSCKNLRAIAVGNYSYKWENLRLGDLNGNRFKIVLRHIKASDSVIEEAVHQFKTTGFINYFGLQRFGQSALVPTYTIGKAILKNDWKLAVELILKPRPGESCYRDVKEARDTWWKTRDASDALKPLTRKDKTIEGKILVGLKKHGPNAYQNAFDNLPRHTVTLYLHSYQSLIWNKIVSRRIKQYGLKVLPGDLVRADPELSKDEDPVEADGKDDSEEEEEKRDLSEFESGYSSKVKVRPLTAQEAETANIMDVMYPLPGDDIRLPDNEVGSWYAELLQEDGNSMDCFRKVNKKYGMHGSYRTMLERAEDVSWQTVRYSDHDEDIIQSDFEIMNGKAPPRQDPEGPYKALIIEFNLKVCSYATMALRELAKCETSTSSQAMLTKQARQEDMAKKRQKLDKDEGQSQEMEVETVVVENHTSSKTVEQCPKSVMETEEISTESQRDDDDRRTRELKEITMREAVGDNLINKYIESDYHLSVI